MTTLYWARAEARTLPAALNAAAMEESIGMVSTTAWHGFVRNTNRALDRGDGTIDPATVFEARFFDSRRELRWVHDSGGQGTAVLVSEDDTGLTEFGEIGDTSVHTTFEQTQLLWGTVVEGSARNGWVTLREHRVGALRVPGLPAPPTDRSRAALTVREYVELDHYGNASVFDELITGLRWEPVHGWDKPDQPTREVSR